MKEELKNWLACITCVSIIGLVITIFVLITAPLFLLIYPPTIRLFATVFSAFGLAIILTRFVIFWVDKMWEVF